MVAPSSRPEKPSDLLRSSTEQIRRAVDLLADIAGDTEMAALAARTDAEAEDAARRVEQTVRTAQGSFATTLRLIQEQERPEH